MRLFRLGQVKTFKNVEENFRNAQVKTISGEIRIGYVRLGKVRLKVKR